MSRPFIFLCMPITPRSVDKNHAVEFLEFIRAGAQIAVELIRMGACVYCPGNDFVYWLVDSGLTPTEIYAQDLSVIIHGDALVAAPGWNNSENCLREVETAKQVGLPVFYWAKDQVPLRHWIETYASIF